MVDLANKVLAWLNGVNADYTELYNAVRDLSCHAELSSVESELRTRQNDETEAVLSGDELRARSREGTEELARSEADLLKDKISETREELRKLEEESVEKEREVDVLNSCLHSHIAIKNEEREFDGQLFEKHRNLEETQQRFDEVEAAVRQSIKALLEKRTYDNIYACYLCIKVYNSPKELGRTNAPPPPAMGYGITA
ncbi:hypothetical protein CFP56_016850 [Quercus suber]|uniref:Uncharacterized protein n=1 Tax=Quercus suber TaxID=58331 RepID=A0AAW0KPG5_QUESU